jgi:lipopolysaccharide export system protein LptA
MSAIRRRGHWLLLVAVLAAAPALAAPPQPSKGPPNALQGFSQNRNEPVHIEAATLEVRDKQKEATFSGDVHVVQGDTDLRCKTLVVFYEGGPGSPSPAPTKSPAPPADNKTLTAAEAGPNGEQRIKRLEARGGVTVTQKDQTATGALGIFDMKTNTVTLTGNVVMTQGKNVLRGDRLVVNLTSGVSRVESGKNGSGRVQGLFLPGNGAPVLPGGSPTSILPGGKGATTPPPVPAPAPTRPTH